MTKILCAIDDTDHSVHAIALATKIADALDAELTFLAVNQLIGGYSRGGSPELLWNKSQEQQVLARATDVARKAGLNRIETAVVESRDPAQAIIYFAESNAFDHIVIGSGGKNAVVRLVLGSVSRDVVYRAHCPVTVVR